MLQDCAYLFLGSDDNIGTCESLLYNHLSTSGVSFVWLVVWYWCTFRHAMMTFNVFSLRVHVKSYRNMEGLKYQSHKRELNQV